MSILDTIDGALRDYEASGDAMRWVPKEKRETRPRTPLGAGISLDGSNWVPVNIMEAPVLVRSGSVITVDTAGLNAAVGSLGRDMARVAEGFRRMAEVLQPIVSAQVKALNQVGHSIHKSLYPKQHQRCVTCHPRRKPKPLAVNGHEYQRRLRARRRRRRG